MSQTSPRIRIEKIELQNFRGVNKGVVEFNCMKAPSEKDTCSDILGIYGQNGSGKSTLLEALHVAKLAMMGRKIPYDKYGTIIAQGADSARISILFQVSNNDGTLYHLEYAFSLGTWEISNIDKKISRKNKQAIKTAYGMITSTAISTTVLASALSLGVATAVLPVVGAAGIVASQIMKSSNPDREVMQLAEKRIAIFDEVLNMSGSFNGENVRLGPVFDTRTTETVFLPKTKQKAFFPKNTAESLKRLQEQKKKSLVNSKSLIFCDEVSQLLLEQTSENEYAKIIFNLKAFALQKIRVLDSKSFYAVGNDIIPLYTAGRGIGIKRSDSTAFLGEEGLKTLHTAINGLNVVLQQVIPGLSLVAVRQVDIDANDKKVKSHSAGTKVTVYSVRNNVRIPLAEESAGIIRLISAMGLFVYAFANQDVTVAIDEIDAGVYEYLLGELLLIFEEYGSGQLLFSCHNLRPMEVLDKKFIYFTTTNPENRYLKPKNIRNENNLRDVYLREIVMGGQEEDLYSAAKHGRIASALQKAGEIIGQD